MRGVTHSMSSEYEKGPASKTTPVSALLAAGFARGAEHKTSVLVQVDTDPDAQSYGDPGSERLTLAEVLKAEEEDVPGQVVDVAGTLRESRGTWL